MRKKYMAPRVRVVEMESVDIIANSGTPVTPTRAKSINRTATDEWGDVADTRTKLWGED